MRALAKPKPAHQYDADGEVRKLRDHRDRQHDDPKDSRNIPAVGQAGHVLIATWNIANLGVHDRRPSDAKVIAEILSWFEIVAIQEVADDLSGFRSVASNLPDHFAWLFSDRAGNDERAAFVYDTRRVRLDEKIGEIVIVESDRRHVKLAGVDEAFAGFNRNPYIAGFDIDGQKLLLANCHLLYGPTSPASARRKALRQRQLEAYALSRWCDLRRRDKDAWTTRILALGDFNLPHAMPGDAIHDALTSRGLELPDYQTRIPTNVSDSYDYDHVLVAPGLKRRLVKTGVFDFDEVVFADIYDSSRPGYWRTCAKYYVSDHRPAWAQLQL